MAFKKFKLTVITQWEHFIQKGGQNFFLFRFLLFVVKIMFSTILWDLRRFFGKIRTGQFVGKIQATALSSLHGKNYTYPKWFMIAICGLHQLLVWSSEISSWCIRHFSSDPLPFQYSKTAEALKKKHVIRDLKILFGWGALGCVDFFSLESRDLGL
jgi:hypothetical protein